MVLKEFSLTLTFCPFLTYITVCEVFGKQTTYYFCPIQIQYIGKPYYRTS